MNKSIFQIINLILFLLLWFLKCIIIVFISNEVYGSVQPNFIIAFGGLITLFTSYNLIVKINKTSFFKIIYNKITSISFLKSYSHSNNNSPIYFNKKISLNSLKNLSLKKNRFFLISLISLCIIIISSLSFNDEGFSESFKNNFELNCIKNIDEKYSKIEAERYCSCALGVVMNKFKSGSEVNQKFKNISETNIDDLFESCKFILPKPSMRGRTRGRTRGNNTRPRSKIR